MTHDYEAAMLWIKAEYSRVEDVNAPKPFIHETIIHALKIADKLMQEPSVCMLIAGLESNAGPRSTAHTYIYKAMRDKMLKEVE